MSNDAPSRPSRTVLGRMVHVVRSEPVACQGAIQSGHVTAIVRRLKALADGMPSPG